MTSRLLRCAARLCYVVVLLIGISILAFSLFAVLPGDPAAATCGKSCTPEIIAQRRQTLGYDQPIVRQYAAWMFGMVRGREYEIAGAGQKMHCAAPCLGYSFESQEFVTELIKQAFPATVAIMVGAVVLWVPLSVLAGVGCVLWYRRWPDHLIQRTALVGQALPPFALAALLYAGVISGAGWLPTPDYYPPHQDFGKFVTSMVLPWLTVAITMLAFYIRLVRGLLVSGFMSDYARTARSHGLTERQVLTRHLLPASVAPLVTATGMDLGILFGGIAVAEKTFNIPGLGRLAIASIQSPDLPVVAAVVLVTGCGALAANVGADRLARRWQPRRSSE